MNVAGESADEVIKLTLQTFEVVARVSGQGLREAIILLRAIEAERAENSIGQTNLLNMMKTCKNIEILTLQRKDLDAFVEHAKSYGIKYSTILDVNDNGKDGIVDILIRGEDVARANSLIKKYKLNVVASVETEEIKEKTKEELQKGKNTEDAMDMLLEESVPEKNTEDEINLLLSESAKSQVNSEILKEKADDGVSDLFLIEENPSENLLQNKTDTNDIDRKVSVRAELKQCKKEIENLIPKEPEKKKITKKNKSKKKSKRKGGKKNERNR